MPLYEYQCENCGEVFELIQKFSDEPTAIHEKCGGKVHRLISAPALHFKGTGWYITDYAKGGSNNPTNGSAKEGDGSSGGKDKKDAAASSSKESASGSSSSDSSKSDSSKSESSKSDSSSKDSSKPSSTPAPATSSTSSDKK